MITPLSKPASVESLGNKPARASTALPGFNRLAGAACAAGLLPIALLMLGGRGALAASAALGVAISLGVCGLLFLFIERVMPTLAGAARSGTGPQGSQFQFLLLLGAKLAFIALVGAAFLTLRHVNPVAVLVGFAAGQTSMVLSALRFRKV